MVCWLRRAVARAVGRRSPKHGGGDDVKARRNRCLRLETHPEDGFAIRTKRCGVTTDFWAVSLHDQSADALWPLKLATDSGTPYRRVQGPESLVK